MQQVWEMSTVWSCSPPASSGKQHSFLCRLQRQQKSPDSVAMPEKPFTGPWRLPEPDGSGKASREEQAKQSPAKHKQIKKKKPWKSSKPQFKVQSLPRGNEGGGQEMLLLHSDSTCEAMQPASLSLFPSSPQSFLHPRRCFSSCKQGRTAALFFSFAHVSPY